ncbi:hypothetical protein [Pelagicoccus mobilis]|uniref:DUF4956 domain-containing protein n=1 Tax=Pelagicoccus mobilis TaxID=415221 RepID=A0A934RY39_9BACT|nr:hypothetical protein [Pelagicoccus mobilis]MBK1877605.1 hypothetical protein [Pelagicoccus mobilis]
MRPKLKKALLKNTVHYLILVAVAALFYQVFPSSLEYLPVGTSERIFSTTSNALEFESTVHSGRLQEQGLRSHALFFMLCFSSSLLVSIPVGRAYLATHTKKTVDPSIAKAIVLLPIAVTGLVLIVQNSLALAFSLAGIVAGAGIRFRTNMREFTDTLYFLISIGIGLSAGIGSLGLALMMSIIFCYAILIIHAMEYGESKKKPKSKPAAETEEIPTLLDK